MINLIYTFALFLDMLIGALITYFICKKDISKETKILLGIQFCVVLIVYILIAVSWWFI